MTSYLPIIELSRFLCDSLVLVGFGMIFSRCASLDRKVDSRHV